MPQAYFHTQMADYRVRVQSAVDLLADELYSGSSVFGDLALIPVDALLAQYRKGGKRIRGILTIVGYEMLGGQDTAMIDRAAAAIELMHTYILAIDDIQDGADKRHNLPVVHKAIEQDITIKNYAEPESLGWKLALNGALSAAHFANTVFSRLKNVDPNYKLRAIYELNQTMYHTAAGQTLDILLPRQMVVSEAGIFEVMDLKTGRYTITSPVKLGMILAGASESDLKFIEKYGLYAGRAFQITDDLLPYISSASGKDNASDIKEGKATLVMNLVLKIVASKDREFLQKCLRNKNLSDTDFKKCVIIIQKSGAITKCQKIADQCSKTASKQAQKFPSSWRQTNKQYLINLCFSFTSRKV